VHQPKTPGLLKRLNYPEILLVLLGAFAYHLQTYQALKEKVLQNKLNKKLGKKKLEKWKLS
jgi:hypothetical protein